MLLSFQTQRRSWCHDKKGKSGCGIKRIFRDGLAGLGKDAEKVKDDVAPRMKKSNRGIQKI